MKQKKPLFLLLYPITLVVMCVLAYLGRKSNDWRRERMGGIHNDNYYQASLRKQEWDRTLLEKQFKEQGDLTAIAERVANCNQERNVKGCRRLALDKAATLLFNGRDHEKTTPEKIIALLEQGYAINYQRNPYGDTVLHSAIRRGYPLRLVQFLVEKGADWRKKPIAYDSALVVAIQADRSDVASWLLTKFPEIAKMTPSGGRVMSPVMMLRGEMPPESRETPRSTLALAQQLQRTEIITLLKQADASVSGSD